MWSTTRKPRRVARSHRRREKERDGESVGGDEDEDEEDEDEGTTKIDGKMIDDNHELYHLTYGMMIGIYCSVCEV